MLATGIDSIRADVEQAESLLGNFYAPWDADDTRPLFRLKEALDAQQRALTNLLVLVEHERKCRQVLTGRVNGAEVAR